MAVAIGTTGPDECVVYVCLQAAGVALQRHSAPSAQAARELQRGTGTELAAAARSAASTRSSFTNTLVQPMCSDVRLYLGRTITPAIDPGQAHADATEHAIGITRGHHRAVGFGMAQAVPAVVADLQLWLQEQAATGIATQTQRVACLRFGC